MLQAYQGFLKTEVQLIADNSLLVKIPTNKKITIFWEEISENKTSAQTNKDEIAQRQEMVKSLKGCLAGYNIDLTQIREERIATTRDEEFLKLPKAISPSDFLENIKK